MLVDEIYNQFKHEFYPGEIAIATINEHRVKVAIREKAKFSAITLPSGEVKPAHCTCRVELLSSPDQEAFIDESELMRDRKYFTKVILKTFIKYSVHRESWAGAPWLVKDEYAKTHRIDQTIPIHLQRHKGQPSPEDLKQQRQERREQQRQEKLKLKQERALEAKRLKQEARQLKLDQIMESKSSRQKEIQRIKQQQKQLQQQQKDLLSQDQKSNSIQLQQLQIQLDLHHKKQQKLLQNHNPLFNDSSNPVSGTPGLNGENENSLLHSNLVHILPNNLATPSKDKLLGSGTVTPLPYDSSPAPNAQTAPPSALNYGAIFSKSEKLITQDDLTFPYDPIRYIEKPKLKREEKLDPPYLINTALETWLFINMCSEPLVLDTFTFDDYLDVLKYNDPDTECPLLNEIFCALLSTFVGTENTDLLVAFPDPPIDPADNQYDDEDDEGYKSENSNDKKNSNDDDSNQQQDKDVEMTDINGKERKDVNGNINGNKSPETKNEDESETKDNAALSKNKHKKSKSNEDENEVDEVDTNRAEAYARFKSTYWDERLRRRLFKDGGWQVILIGLLYDLLYVKEWKDDITRILDVLAPLDKPVTLHMALSSFMNLSIELRLKAIQILCNLLHNSSLVRNFIDQCLEESARIKRERLDNLREYKVLLDELKALEEQKKPYFPNGFPKASHTGTGVGTPSINDNNDSAEESDDEQKYQLFSSVGKRPASLITIQRKKRKNEAESALAKENAEFRVIFQKCEDLLVKIDKLLNSNRKCAMELIKLDTQRAKMLGKDRYHNRYWWLEGNGIRRISDDDDENNSGNNNGKKNSDKKSKSKQPSKSISPGPSKDQNKRFSSKSSYEESKDNNDKHAEDEGNEGDSDLGYLMGRLWVQGPMDDEIRGYLKVVPDSKFPRIERNEKGELILVGEFEKVDAEPEIKKETNYTTENGVKEASSTQDFNEANIKEDKDMVGVKTTNLKSPGQNENTGPTFSKVLVKADGTVADNITIAERKLLEEQDFPLVNYSTWGFYDDPEDINALIRWLNPYGVREFKLAKEIMNLKSEISDSMRARKEDLENDRQEQEEELKETLKDDEDVDKLDKKISKLEEILTFTKEVLHEMDDEGSTNEKPNASPTDEQVEKLKADLEEAKISLEEEKIDDEPEEKAESKEPEKSSENESSEEEDKQERNTRRKSNKRKLSNTFDEEDDSIASRKRSSRFTAMTPSRSKQNLSKATNGIRRSTRAASRRVISDDEQTATSFSEPTSKKPEEKQEQAATNNEKDKKSPELSIEEKQFKNTKFFQKAKSKVLVEIENAKKEKEDLIESYKQEFAQGRVLGWENGKAKEVYGYSLYESHKRLGKSNSSNKSGKRKR